MKGNRRRGLRRRSRAKRWRGCQKVRQKGGKEIQKRRRCREGEIIQILVRWRRKGSRCK